MGGTAVYEVNENTRKILIFSDHLKMRAQQRGISYNTIDLIAYHGKKNRVKDGLFQRMIGKSEANKLIQLGTSSPSDVERTKGKKLITVEDPNGKIVVVTVYQYSRPTTKITGHFYRSHNRAHKRIA